MGCYITRHTKRIQTGEPVDMKGYTCYAKKLKTGSNMLIAEVYCDYGIIQSNGDFDYYGNGYGSVYSASDGSLMYTESLSDGFGENFFENSYYYYEVYGDVRYSDGSKAPTNDPIIVPAKFDCIICK